MGISHGIVICSSTSFYNFQIMVLGTLNVSKIRTTFGCNGDGWGYEGILVLSFFLPMLE